MVEDAGENPHVEHCVPHGATEGVFAGDDADGVERHAFERGVVARAVVAPHKGRALTHRHVEPLHWHSTCFAGGTLASSAQCRVFSTAQ